MIKELITLLKANNYYAVSESIEIAKGKYKAPETIKEGIKQAKRKIQWQKKK
jgi:hypothetical protein